jgi:Ca2+-binding EF-hand superfamily protein
MDMSSRLQMNSYGQIFDLLNLNRNSYVDMSDVNALVTRLTTAFPSAPAEKKAAVQAAFASLWENVAALADSDGDGRISRTEFLAAFTEVTRSGLESFDKMIRPIPQAVFDLCDTDGDGRISAGEFRVMHEALGSPAPAKLALAALDLDDDGRLTLDELMDAAREFLLSRH